MFRNILASLFALISLSVYGQSGFKFVPKPEKKQIDLLYNNQLLTSYCYYDSIMKPILFPLVTPDGVTVTRGYPINPRPGERTDHPHHTGLWMNYESVNGLDFWNNSTAIAPDKRDHYGTIRHTAVVSQKAGKDKATLMVTANWHRPDGHVLLKETTEFVFTVMGKRFIIDRNSDLVAQDLKVDFADVKDGFIGIRLARELEMPSKEPGLFTDGQGNITKVPLDNNGVTGMYKNSDGVKGDSVWSTKGPWALINGKKDGKDITVAIIDNPSNPGYPTYWHARGYGLFAANPLGRKVFSNGRETLNYSLAPQQKTTFKYRVVVASEKIDSF